MLCFSRRTFDNWIRADISDRTYLAPCARSLIAFIYLVMALLVPRIMHLSILSEPNWALGGSLHGHQSKINHGSFASPRIYSRARADPMRGLFPQ